VVVAYFLASAGSTTFVLVSTDFSITSIPVTGVGGSSLPWVVEAVEVISDVLCVVSVVTAVTLDGSMAGVDVKAGTLSTDLEVWDLILKSYFLALNELRVNWSDWRPSASSTVSPSWPFSPSGGKLSFRGVPIILFLLGLDQVQLKLEGETFVDPFVELLQSGTFFTFPYF
jgi:hypothetical protein